MGFRKLLRWPDHLLRRAKRRKPSPEGPNAPDSESEDVSRVASFADADDQTLHSGNNAADSQREDPADSQPGGALAVSQSRPERVDEAAGTAQQAHSGPDPASLSWNDPWIEVHKTVKKQKYYQEALAVSLGVGKDSILGSISSNPEEDLSDADDPVDILEKRLDRFQDLAKKKLESFEENQLAVPIHGKRYVVQDAIGKAIDIVLKSKDIVSNAVSAQPHAALAWTCVMVGITTIREALNQDKDAVDGYNKIASLLVRYRRLEEGVLRPEFSKSSQTEIARKLLLDIGNRLVDTYTDIYIYVLRIIIQYGRSKPLQKLRNIVGADDWKARWGNIESASSQIDNDVRTHATARGFDMLQTVGCIRIEIEESKQRELLDKIPCSGAAIFDSADVESAASPCLEGTRSGILCEIQDWAQNANGEMIFWLHGMAGTGKTSVALAVAKNLSARQSAGGGSRDLHPSVVFGASFFFKQGDVARENTRNFFSTLAWQLAELEGFKGLRPHIINAINKKKDIGSKGTRQQFEKLILGPLIELNSEATLPIQLVVVVDALDECGDQNEVDELLQRLGELDGLYNVQLRVFITSRRNQHIADSFKSHLDARYRDSLLDKIEQSANEDEPDDIQRFLSHTLTEFAKKRELLPDWIDGNDIEKLHRVADGLFLYAATACRFLEGGITDNQAHGPLDPDDAENLKERLDSIVSRDTQFNDTQGIMDEIYAKVLSFPGNKSTPREKERFYRLIKDILGCIAIVFEPVSPSSLVELLPDNINQERPNQKQLKKYLRQLHAVVDIPPNETAPLGLVHLSFREFLLSDERSKNLPFHVDEESMHATVFDRCLKILCSDLHQDICKLKWPGRKVSDIPRNQIDENISQHLRYACRFWASHLAKLSSDQREGVGLTDGGKIDKFLREKSLFWLEAMSLIRETTAAVLIIIELEALCNSTRHPALSIFLHDIKRFVSKNRWVIERAPLQIYCSALLFSPEESETRSSFRHLIPPWITQTPNVEKDWSPELTTLVGHSKQAFPLAFSPSDNNILVTSSFDNTTKVWNCITGAELYNFEEPNTAWCAAFSADGKKIALGLGKLIRIREVAKGGLVDLIVDPTGEPPAVSYLAFSPKTSSILAAIVCRDPMVPPYPEEPGRLQIWNVSERKIRFSITEWDITIVAFSPSGDYVAVGDGDGRIGFWGLENGDRRLVFKPHEKPVEYIPLFLDGGLLVSVDADGDYKLWNIVNGLAEREFRSDTVLSCSANGDLVVVQTPPDILEVRRTSSWDLVGTFGKAGLGGRAALSKDGNLLSQGVFEDNRVWLWGRVSQTAVFKEQYREGVPPRRDSHGYSIAHAGFLPGSDEEVVVVKGPPPENSNGRLQIWRHDGQIKDLTLPHWVRNVCISPDKRFVGLEARGSTVQLWDGKMERVIAEYDASGIVFSPDGSCFALLSEDNTTIMKAVNNAAPEKKAVFEGERSRRRSVTFSEDARRIGWLQAERLHVWDLEAMEEMVSEPCFPTTPRRGTIAFLPDGGVWAAIVENGTMTVSRTLLPGTMTRQKKGLLLPDTQEYPTTGFPHKEVFSQPVDATRVRGVAISTIGRLVVLFSKDLIESTYFYIQMWDLGTGADLGRYGTNTQIDGLSFSEDCRYLDCPQGQLPLPLPDQGMGPDGAYLCIGNEWIISGFDNLIWLPPTYQRRCGSVKGQTLAIEVFDRVIIIKIDLSQIPSLDRP